MAVTGSRRQAILDAMVHVVGGKGYVGTSVADVLRQAGASRTTFYRNFDDKHDCFLAAYELAAERVLGEVSAACEGERPWSQRVAGAIAELAATFSREPELARTLVVEGTVTGGEARRLHWAALTRFARLLDAGSVPAPGATPPASAGLMGASAVAGLLFDGIQAERPGELARLLPELTFAALVPYVGPRLAAEAARVGAVGAQAPSR